MVARSVEQLRRLAHLNNGGTLANYDRSHYPQKEETNETNNYEHGREYLYHEPTN